LRKRNRLFTNILSLCISDCLLIQLVIHSDHQLQVSKGFTLQLGTLNDLRLWLRLRTIVLGYSGDCPIRGGEKGAIDGKW